MNGISVVIVCYKSELELRGLIESIFFHADVPLHQLQIIVIDNYGNGLERVITDDLSKQYESEFIYIKSDLNGGYGAGNNIGINLAKFDIVCVVNPDVRFIKPMFRKVISEFGKNSKLLALSGEQISSTKNSYFIRPEFQLPIIKAILGRYLRYIGGFHARFMALSGALTFYEKTLFADIGKFDESIFLYCEESDVSIRAHRARLEIAYFHEVKYVHLDWDRAAPSIDTIKYLLSSVSYYEKKHKISCKGYFLAGWVHFYLRYVWLLLRGKSDKVDDLKKVISIYKATYKGE